MSQLVYVDETKAKRYVMAAVSLHPKHAVMLRRSLRTLILPGQTNLHMRSESDRRRHQILRVLMPLLQQYGVGVALYDAGARDSEVERRKRCLRAIVQAVGVHPRVSLIFERDETLVQFDRQVLIQLLRETDLSARVSYEHINRRHDYLLAMPDVFAWCWNRGGRWRQAIRPHLSEVRTLAP